MTPVLEARQLAKTYETGGAKVLGLRGVDISVERGDSPVLRLQPNRDATKRPRTPTRARTNPPVDTLMDGPEPGEAPALELPPMARTMTAVPSGALVPPAKRAPAREQDPQGGPPELDLEPEPEAEPEQRRVSVPISEGTMSLPDVVRELDRAGVPVEDVALRRPSLDEVFLQLTGKTSEEVAA